MIKRPRQRCLGADTYEPLLPPKCGDEKYFACHACVVRWQTAQAKRVVTVQGRASMRTTKEPDKQRKPKKANWQKVVDELSK